MHGQNEAVKPPGTTMTFPTPENIVLAEEDDDEPKGEMLQTPTLQLQSKGHFSLPVSRPLMLPPAAKEKKRKKKRKRLSEWSLVPRHHNVRLMPLHLKYGR